jgi:SAM-dependent methyltransferase
MIMTRMRALWRSWYDRFLAAEKEALAFPGPASVLRHYNSFTSYFRVRAAWEFARCRGGDRVLLVGDAGGKDYWFFRWQGLEPAVVDVAEQELIGEVMIHDISAPELPFAPQSFDAIVMCDVLEHLYDDIRALANLRLMLKDNGRLVLSGPYWHDLPEHHVRIHSPRIIRRMLGHHGFSIQEFTARGFLVNLYRVLHPLFLLGHVLAFLLTGRTRAMAFNQRLYALVQKAQTWPAAPYLDRVLFGMRGGLNGYVLAALKSEGERYDGVAVNREQFANLGREKERGQKGGCN